ncbi:alpha/beta hydrolase [Mesorhizobium sp. SB112]|uniref:alpha/beta fold hydrolase n=1 Tax=Mesorhizobium sp. SB112 TaxID=3151853 RepID=UPI003267AE9B
MHAGEIKIVESGGFKPDRRLTASGTAYFESGFGEPLILIHGVGMRLEAWGPQIASLSSKNRVIAVDMPGHGESKKLPTGSRLEDFVSWFSVFLDDLNIEKANVAGHSMGALIAGGAAATMGDRIARIAYLNGVYRRDPAAKAAVLARAAAIPVKGVDTEGPLERWFGDDAHSVVARELTREWLGSVDPEGYATAYSAFANGDKTYADRWPDVTAPALFLTGSDDPNSTPLMAKEMAAAAPNGWACIVEGQRHMVNLTAPETVNELMIQWLRIREEPA